MSSEALSFVAPPPEELAVLLPGYSIHSLIACGGMGAVYHARQIALDREVAIKILPREFSSDTSFRDGFAAEAKAMAKLNHPNLIGVYDFGEIAGMLFLAMEYVPGDSLYTAANGRAIDSREAARIMADICSGIAHAHEHGILHRDIKPANILLDSNARPKIGDFGLARPIGLATKEGEPIYGTPHYTAPEVVAAPSSVDARADIFSLGVVLHELLTGKLPAADPRSPSAIIGCNPRFDAIVKKATQPDPVLRYINAADMARELSACIKPAGGPRLQKAPPRARRSSAPVIVKKSDGSGWVVALILLAGLGAAAFFLLRDDQQKDSSPPAEQTTTGPVSPPPSANLPAPSKNGADTSRPPLPQDQSQPAPTGRRTAFGSTAPPEAKYDGPAPVFDVESFLQRAQSIMRQKAAPELAARNREAASNVERLAQILNRSVRSVSRSERDQAEAGVQAALERIRENANRVPPSLSIPGVDKDTVQRALSDALDAQEATDSRLVSALRSHASTYIRGIELQIERIPGDIGAIRILRDEIEATRNDEDYFPSLLLD